MYSSLWWGPDWNLFILEILPTTFYPCVSVCPSLAQASPSYQRPSPTLLEPTSSARWHTRWGGRREIALIYSLSHSPSDDVISVSAPINEFSEVLVFVVLLLLKSWRCRASLIWVWTFYLLMVSSFSFVHGQTKKIYW